MSDFLEENPPFFRDIAIDQMALDPSVLAMPVKLSDEVNEDITDSSQYSI